MLDPFILENYEIEERRHALAILAQDFPEEFEDIQDTLRRFRLPRSEILTPGGRKSNIAGWLDSQLSAKGWQEKKFTTQMRFLTGI